MEENIKPVNRAVLSGTVMNLPHITHEYDEVRYYGFDMSCPRLNGKTDRIPVVFSNILNLYKIRPGKEILIYGELRSAMKDGHLIEFFFMKSVISVDFKLALNMLKVDGKISKEPFFRDYENGKKRCHLFIDILDSDGFPRSFTAIAYGTAAEIGSELVIGDNVSLYGRLLEHSFTTKDEEDTEEKERHILRICILNMRVKKDDTKQSCVENGL